MNMLKKLLIVSIGFLIVFSVAEAQESTQKGLIPESLLHEKENNDKKDSDKFQFQQYYSQLPDVSSCTPGVLKESVIQDILNEVNYIRSLHNLSPVTYAEEGRRMSMEGCLNIVASGTFGHIDDPSSECYTPGGGEARMKSNLHYSTADRNCISSIIGWMIDSYAQEPLGKVGHRRAIINPFLKKFAFGRADGNPKSNPNQYVSAMSFLYQDYVTGSIQNDIEFVAYPYENYPPHYVDKSFYLSFNVIYNKSSVWANKDVDYSNAKVTVTNENDQEMTVHDIYYGTEGWGSLPNNLSFKVQGLQNEVKYNVSVSNVKAGGQTREYNYWFRLTDKDQSEPPEAPELAVPENGKTGVSTEPAFSWQVTQNAVTYSIQVAKDNGFNDMFWDKTNISKTSIVSEVTLETTAEYFWRVRAVNAAGESEWSEVRNFTTRQPKPEAVIGHEPADGTEGIALTPTFVWASDQNATNYDFEISKREDFSGWPVLSESGIEDTSFTIPAAEALDKQTEYFWKVRSANEDFSSNWSDVYSFTTGDGSSVFEINGENSYVKVYPNPVSDEMNISYDLSKARNVSLTIYNEAGNMIYTADLGYQPAGNRKIHINIKFNSGAYFFRLSAGEDVLNGKFTVEK